MSVEVYFSKQVLAPFWSNPWRTNEEKENGGPPVPAPHDSHRPRAMTQPSFTNTPTNQTNATANLMNTRMGFNSTKATATSCALKNSNPKTRQWSLVCVEIPVNGFQVWNMFKKYARSYFWFISNQSRSPVWIQCHVWYFGRYDAICIHTISAQDNKTVTLFMVVSLCVNWSQVCLTVMILHEESSLINGAITMGIQWRKEYIMTTQISTSTTVCYDEYYVRLIWQAQRFFVSLLQEDPQNIKQKDRYWRQRTFLSSSK